MRVGNNAVVRGDYSFNFKTACPNDKLLARFSSRLAGTGLCASSVVGENTPRGREPSSSFESRGCRSRNTTTIRSRERRNAQGGWMRHTVRGSCHGRRDGNRNVVRKGGLVVGYRLSGWVAALAGVRVEVWPWKCRVRLTL